MKPTLTIRVTSHMALVRASAEKAAGLAVRVGILGGDSQKPADPTLGTRNPATLTEIAIYNEFGAPRANIPERPFLRSTFAKNEEKYRGELRKALRALLTKDADIRELMNKLGMMMVEDVKRTIENDDQVPPPNAPSTLAAKTRKTMKIQRRRKKNKGKTKAEIRAISAASVRTLVDTGQLVRHLAHEVTSI